MNSVRASLVILLVPCITACSIGPIDLDGRQCPCAPGWICDNSRGICVSPTFEDSGTDADVPDAETGDGGPDTDAENDRPDSDVDNAGPDGDIDNDGTDADVDDGGIDETSCDDVNAGALFCSGFEQAMLLDWDGTTRVFNGIVEWSDEAAYRGLGSLHVEATEGQSRAEIAHDLETGVTSGELYVRFYAFVGPADVSHQLDAFSLISMTNPSNGLFLRLYPTSPDLRMVVGTAGTHFPATSDIPRDRWVCVQVGVTLGESGSVSVAFDGDEVVNQSGHDTRVTGGFRRLNIGIVNSSTTNTSGELYYDEVVLDDNPIPCD